MDDDAWLVKSSPYRHLQLAGLSWARRDDDQTAARTPFIYVPLEHHFEQNFHVRHRLERYGAGRAMSYADAADPDRLARAIVEQASGPASFRPVETDGAARAAAMLAELL